MESRSLYASHTIMARLKSWLMLLGCVGAVQIVFRNRDALGAPIINDVSTSLDDPPAYSNPLIGSLPEEFKPQIRKHYHNLRTLHLPVSSAHAFQAAADIARSNALWTVKLENRCACMAFSIQSQHMLY